MADGDEAEVEHATGELSLADRKIAFRVIDDLKTSIRALTLAFQNVDTFAQRTRRIITWVGWTLALAVIGSGLAVFAYAHADRADNKSDINSKYLLESCRAANESRADQRALWDSVFTISGPPKTKAEAVKTARFKETISKIFAERDCSKVAEGKVK